MEPRRIPISIKDARYSGGEALLLAWDAWQSNDRDGARYLLRSADGTYIVHDVIREANQEQRQEQIRQISASDAHTLFQQMRIRIVNVFNGDVSNPSGVHLPHQQIR